jgi:hypothetical protein
LLVTGGIDFSSELLSSGNVDESLFLFHRLLKMKYTIAANTSTPPGTPRPIPTIAPLLKPQFSHFFAIPVGTELAVELWEFGKRYGVLEETAGCVEDLEGGNDEKDELEMLQKNSARKSDSVSIMQQMKLIVFSKILRTSQRRSPPR